MEICCCFHFSLGRHSSIGWRKSPLMPCHWTTVAWQSLIINLDDIIKKANLRCFFFVFLFRYFAHLSKSSLNNKRVVSPLLFRVFLRARATKHKFSSSFALHHLLLAPLTNQIQFLLFCSVCKCDFGAEKESRMTAAAMRRFKHLPGENCRMITKAACCCFHWRFSFGLAFFYPFESIFQQSGLK